MNPTEDWLTQPDGLAERFHAMRTKAGLSGKELAEASGWQASKVSRLENGRQLPTPADIDTLANACGADAETRHQLMSLLGEIQTIHRDWKRRLRRGQVAVQTSYNRLVEDATLVRYFETVVVPGLLQIPDYARRILQEPVVAYDLDSGSNDAAAAVAVRMQRQQALYDPAKQFEFLLAEPVLHWRLPPVDVMRGQLDRLQTVIGLPNIRFGILPMGAQLGITPHNSFQLYDDIAVVETFIGETTHRDEEAAAYARVLDRLWDEAVQGDRARHLIIQAAAALGDG